MCWPQVQVNLVTISSEEICDCEKKRLSYNPHNPHHGNLFWLLVTAASAVSFG